MGRPVLKLILVYSGLEGRGCRVPISCRVPSAEYYDCVVPRSEPSICMF